MGVGGLGGRVGLALGEGVGDGGGVKLGVADGAAGVPVPRGGCALGGCALGEGLGDGTRDGVAVAGRATTLRGVELATATLRVGEAVGARFGPPEASHSPPPSRAAASSAARPQRSARVGLGRVAGKTGWRVRVGEASARRSAASASPVG